MTSKLFCHPFSTTLGLIRSPFRFALFCQAWSPFVRFSYQSSSSLSFGGVWYTFVGSSVGSCFFAMLCCYLSSLSQEVWTAFLSRLCQEVPYGHAFSASLPAANHVCDSSQNSSPVFAHLPCYWTTSACFQRNMPGTGLRVLQLPPRGARRDLRPDFG
jgi:hypothetical protein